MALDETRLREQITAEILAVIDGNNGFTDWPRLYMFGVLDGLHRAAAIASRGPVRPMPAIDRRHHGPRID